MAKYSELTEKEKNDLAQYYARELHAALYPSDPRNQDRNPIAFGFGGTVEDALRMLGAEINKYGKAGSVDLINRISKSQATVKGSDFINEALNPNLKGTRKEPFFPKGLRQALIRDLSDDVIGDDKDETEILSLFSYADDDVIGKTAKEQIAMRKGDISKAYTEFSPALETEQDISDIAIENTGILKVEDLIKGPPKPKGLVDLPENQQTEEQKQATKAAEKADIIKRERDKQAALAGTDGAYGYRGGYEQFIKDQQILAPTALGKTERDGSFRLRTPSEVQARIRQGQFNIQEPKREALRNFKNKFEGFQEQREQFIKDTGADPLQIEKFEKPNLLQKETRERQKREMLDKQFKVQEPNQMSPEFAKDLEGLSADDKAEVLRMFREKEKKAFGQ